MLSVSFLTSLGDGIAQITQITREHSIENGIKFPKLSKRRLYIKRLLRGHRATLSNLTCFLNLTNYIIIIQDFDFGRFRNFLVFGFFDGAVSHMWFELLDVLVRGNDFLAVIYRILADNAVSLIALPKNRTQ